MNLGRDSAGSDVDQGGDFLSVAPTAAGVISQRVLWAAGYWVPQDEVVQFRRDDLVMG